MGEVTPASDVAALELAQLQHQCDQMMFWINYKEVIVWPEELRGIPESGLALQEKYNKFNEEVNAQEVRVEEILKVADLMIANNHPDDMLIRRRREELKQSWQRMRKLALKRQMLVQDLGPSQPDQPAPEAGVSEKPKSLKEVASEAQLIRGLLEDFLRLEHFEKDCGITKGWIDETMVVMTNDSHLDPTDLNAKMESHKLLEQDILSRKDRAEILSKIQVHLVEILKMWENLLAATELKSLHMSQAWQLDKFNHGVDNMDVWLNETETVLKSPDFGTDLPTVENLLKEHTLLVKDIQTHKDIVDIISTAATQFSESGHFDLTTIISRKDQVVKRYGGLAALIKERERKLTDSHKANLLFRDIETEEKWIVEKHGRIAGRGKDIETIRQLIRETQSIMQEMHGHDPHVQKIIETGRKLAKNHHLGEEITNRTNALEEHWAELKQKAFERKQSNQLCLLFLFSIKD